MTTKEFTDIVEQGGDIMFDCNGKHYTLLAWYGKPLDIAEQKTVANRKLFNTVDDMLDGYMIDGKTLRSRMDFVTVTYCT